MPRLSANLSFLFTEVPFLERFGAAGRAHAIRTEVGAPNLKVQIDF